MVSRKSVHHRTILVRAVLPAKSCYKDIRNSNEAQRYKDQLKKRGENNLEFESNKKIYRKNIEKLQFLKRYLSSWSRYEVLDPKEILNENTKRFNAGIIQQGHHSLN